jgi:hypothetical protein
MGRTIASDRLTDAEIRERIAHKLQFHTNLAHIARSLDLPYDTVRDVARELDAAETRRLRDAPDEEKGRHIRLINAIVDRSLKSIEQGRVLRDQGFRIVVGEDGKPIKVPAKSREYRTVLLALADIRKIQGLDAPARSVSVDARINATVDAEVMARVLSSEAGQAALLMLEDAVARESGSLPAPAPAAIDVTPAEGGAA